MSCLIKSESDYLHMAKADGRRHRKAAVFYLRLSKEQTLRTQILVFLSI